MHENVRNVVELARRGQLSEAIEAGEITIEASPSDAGLRLLLGAICCRAGDISRGIDHFRVAFCLAPNDVVPRIELARALLIAGKLDEVETVIGSEEDLDSGIGREFARMRAHVRQCRNDSIDAVRLYTALTTIDPSDFESWQGLGLSQLASGKTEQSVDALRRAIRLKPSLPSAQLGLGRALIALDQPEEALEALSAAALADPTNVEITIEIGRAELLRGGFDRAEIAMRRVLESTPDHVEALGGLADMLERANRLIDLRALLDDLDKRGISDPVLRLMRARLLRREGRLDDAMAAVLADVDERDPLRAQTIGEIADQQHKASEAFTAFQRMNDLVLAISPGAEEQAHRYRETVRALSRLTTTHWYQRWTQPASDVGGRRDPAFLFGFPRSGTTLLDTMLMGHPDAIVLEEEAALQKVADRIGAAERLPYLSERDIATARAHYWYEVDVLRPDVKDRLIIDKFPLGLIGTAFIHRLFPNARFIFAERHPCDAVLSCFITRFRLNGGMANFLRLEDAATLYDLTLAYWIRCKTIFPLKVHTVRYENMIVNPEGELRPLAAFLGLDWHAGLVDHRGNAAARAYITSPSYAQVTEPLYRRASGRWRRYASQMEEVLPILAPWAKRMGYAL